ncbi:MAG: hypothetical protein OHK0038_15330 [Flammeovirgaceae bacterium]
MNYLITYDVSNKKLRNKICKCLEKNDCKRVQKSVFLAKEMPPKIKIKLIARLKAFVDETNPDETMHILFVPIDEEVIKKIESIGENALWEEANEKTTFFMF